MCGDGGFGVGDARVSGVEQGSRNVSWINDCGRDGRTAEACR